jgi:hypothetical protein
MMPFIGKAIVVKDIYHPKYQYVINGEGNHTFKVTPDSQNSFEYMIFAAWSEGVVYNNQKDFEAYVQTTAREFNSPLGINFIRMEEKEKK